MPTKRISKMLSRLRGDTSGNAMLLVAMGAPILFGTTGLAVDTAQWYMWQRELQYAADQAALAGAWSRGNDETSAEYQTRARQEFAANVRIVNNYTTIDQPSLADYDDGDASTVDTDNSVVVTASTTGTLPFANFLLGSSTTVRVRAQATFETTEEWTACLYALNVSMGQALHFQGGPNVTAPCGIGAISDADDAVYIGGNAGSYDIGWAITRGGVSDGHGGLGDAEIAENLEDLYDPFADLTPPDNPTPRDLSCGSSEKSWTADRTETIATSYAYYRGKNANNAVSYTDYAEAKESTTDTTTVLGQTYGSEPVSGTSTETQSMYQVSSAGKDKVYEEPTSTITVTYSNIVEIMPNAGVMQPGTYAGFELSCDTTLASGIYVIDGGTLNVNAQYTLTGAGVMFVLKNGAGIQINGGAEINLTPMDASQLIAHGVAAEAAERLAGMLIFEDPNSSSGSDNLINGNATTNLNGVVYLPNSGMTLSGNMHAESACLMIASNTLTITGTADLTTLCPSGEVHDIVVGAGGTRVRLVA